MTSIYYINVDVHGLSTGKLTALDIGNNAITSKGAHNVAEYVKGSKSLFWLNFYMNDIGDEVLNLFIRDLLLKSQPNLVHVLLKKSKCKGNHALFSQTFFFFYFFFNS